MEGNVFMSFYSNFVHKCNEQGKTPTAVALELGIAKSSVSCWKKRNSTPTDVNLIKIANYFGCSVSDLTGEEKEPTHDSVSGSLRTSFYDSLESMSKEELLDVLAAVTDKLRQKSDS